MTWLPRSFKTSDLRQRITVQTPTETRDATGQPIVTWTEFLSNEPAKFSPTGGNESMRGRQLEEHTKAIFTVRYRSGYTTKMRIYHGGQYYGITGVIQVGGGNRFLELTVTS